MTKEQKLIRMMLLHIFVTSKKRNWSVVTFDEIEQHMGRHARCAFSWCEWSTTARILYGCSSGFCIRPEHRDMSTAQFIEFINNKYI